MDWLHDPIKPMLATLVDDIPKGDFLYEVKWDGIRAIIVIDHDRVTIHTRNRNNVTKQFPDLQEHPFNVTTGVFDCEIVCLDKHGRPSFSNILKRVQTTNDLGIKRLVKSHPVQCYVFDCLYLNGKPLIDKPFLKRKEELSKVMSPNSSYRLSDTFEDGGKLYEAIKEQTMEGIIAKKKVSKYNLGKRSKSWQKVKVRHIKDCKIIGYTKGAGSRSSTFGSLQVAEINDGELIYRGKVGTGFSDVKLKQTNSLLDMLDEVEKPNNVPSSKDTVWVKPLLAAKISYSEITSEGIFRAPVFEEFIV